MENVVTLQNLIFLIIGLIVVMVILNKKLNKKESAPKSCPSKIAMEGKDLEIIHKKCGQKVYYGDKDILLGDLELISPTEKLQRGYINCPHCKKQLVFDYND